MRSKLDLELEGLVRRENPNKIQRAAKAIAAAETIFITAGAGIGVDSGLPDFRGNQGFWKIHPNYLKDGLTFADLANPQWFDRNPSMAWGFYGYRYQLYTDTLPHAGFQILSKWQNQAPKPGFVMTSNVDGHFQKSGFAANRVYECHGSIYYLQCTDDCRGRIWRLNSLEFEIDTINLLATGPLPLCPDCGKVARPNILMFGDWYWLSDRSDSQYESLLGWQDAVSGSKIVTIEIGAGSSVGGIRHYSENMPGQLIRINPRESEGPEGTISIEQPALTALKAIDDVLTNKM